MTVSQQKIFCVRLGMQAGLVKTITDVRTLVTACAYAGVRERQTSLS